MHRLHTTLRSLARILVVATLAPIAGCAGEPPPCTAGAPGCACRPGGACDDGASCTDGTCEAVQDRSLVLDAPGARACEILLRDGGEQLASVSYEGARGAHVRESPRTAIAVHSGGEGELSSHAISVRVIGSGAPLSVDSTRCFDADGAPIAAARARIGS